MGGGGGYSTMGCWDPRTPSLHHYRISDYLVLEGPNHHTIDQSTINNTLFTTQIL